MRYQISSQGYSNLIENTISNITPDLICSSSGSTSISYSLNSYNDSSILSWISINSTSGLLKISTPTVASTSSYAFYVSSSVSGVTTLFNKLITIQINKWGVQNCKNWTSTDNKVWSTWNSGYVLSSGSWVIYTESSSSSSSSSANAAESTLISTVSVTSAIILISSIMTFSSFTTIWTLVNQIQCLFFVLLTRIYLPYDVVYFIVGLNFALFPFDSLSFKSSSASTSINDLFDFEQEDDILSKMGLESGSSFVNNYSLFLMIWIYALFHTYIFILNKLVSKLEIKFPRTVKVFHFIYIKMYNFMTLGIYIRTVLEAYQYLLISCLYEFHYFKGTSGNRIASFFPAFEILLICIALLSFTVWFSVFRKQTEGSRDKFDEFLQDIKPGLLSKLYLSIIMIRRFLFITLWASIGFVSPIATISLMFIFQLAYVIYLIIQRPFTKLKLNLIEIITEVFLLFFLCWLFYFNSEDKWNYSSTQAIIWVFSVINMIILIITLGKKHRLNFSWFYHYYNKENKVFQIKESSGRDSCQWMSKNFNDYFSLFLKKILRK